MKHLCIARHAHADHYSPQGGWACVLDAIGHEEAKDMTKRLVKLECRPELLQISPATRAQETARYYQSGLSIPVTHCQTQPLFYDASLEDLINLVHELPDELSHIMWVAHNPGLSELSAYFTSELSYSLPTAGICALEFSVDTWQEVGPDCAKVIFFEVP